MNATPTSSLWISGPTGSGKTQRLIQQFCQWAIVANSPPTQPATQPVIEPVCLLFAPLSEGRMVLVDRLTTSTLNAGMPERYPYAAATPLGFFESEVTLFWSLLLPELDCKIQFPLRLHPETEHWLATQLWQPELTSGELRQSGMSDQATVRRMLDLFHLAASSGVPPEDLPLVLKQGLTEQDGSPDFWDGMGRALAKWRRWCLQRGILTYGLVTELYWRYLLPHPTYQQQLLQRYRAVLADDVDEYPAVMRSLFEFFLDRGVPVALTFNSMGAVRLGLGADPDYLAGLAGRCATQNLLDSSSGSLGAPWGQTLLQCLQEPLLSPQLPDAIQVIQTVSKAQLLRQTAELIAMAIQAGEVQPSEVAIIAPQIDPITRYTLQEILSRKGIAAFSLHSQHPLISYPWIRALLTLLAIVYPGLGRLVEREGVAEMLVVLSQAGGNREEAIDPVRAGLMADSCFIPDTETVQLLPATQFPRWDRLGYQSTQAYRRILQWIEQYRCQSPTPPPSPVLVLDHAVQYFLGGSSHLPYDQQTSLQALMAAAQHYWQVESRLQESRLQESRQDRSFQLALPDHSTPQAVRSFIQMLRAGTITANPYPVEPLSLVRPAVTLSTIYQYRMNQQSHRWQFWLDAGSPHWLTSSGTLLFGAPLFWRDRPNRVWTAADDMAIHQAYLERGVLDLLHRAKERVYLCHCDLAINGQEQTGGLLSIVNAALPVALDA